MVGTSPPALIPFFVEAIRTLQPYPDMLYDIGCGKGIYGYLFTQYNRNKKPLVRGCDLEFKQPLDQFYDVIDKIDLETEFTTFEDYFLRDLALGKHNVVSMMEIIEHLTKETGVKILTLLGKCGVPLILTTPTHFYQSNTPQTPGAKHKCLWTKAELTTILNQYYALPPIVVKIRDTTYRTEHWGIIARNQPLKPIPGGIRDE